MLGPVDSSKFYVSPDFISFSCVDYDTKRLQDFVLRGTLSGMTGFKSSFQLAWIHVEGRLSVEFLIMQSQQSSSKILRLLVGPESETKPAFPYVSLTRCNGINDLDVRSEIRSVARNDNKCSGKIFFIRCTRRDVSEAHPLR